MLIAYDDMGFKIKQHPAEESMVPLRSIETHDQAVLILEWAKGQRPDIFWGIVGDGPYGVQEGPCP